MKFSCTPLWQVMVCISIAVAIAGCGVSQKKLDAAQQRINAIKGMGIADSILSGAEVFLANAATSQRLGNGVMAKSNYDSAITLIVKSEGLCAENSSTLKPFIDSAKAAFVQRRVEVSGPQLKFVDSMLALVDASLSKNVLPDAKNAILSLDSTFPRLVADEKKAKETKPKLTGTWSGVLKITENGADAVRKDVYTFNADGSVTIAEEMKGVTMTGLKEDWKYMSTGTYDCAADTILLHITNETCSRLIYEHLKVDAKGTQRWEKEEKKPFDSTYTDGHKDRYIAFEYLKEHYKKVK